MKLFTHWSYNNDERKLEKVFFGTREAEAQAAKDASDRGHDVLARHEWEIDPTAENLARFCNTQMDTQKDPGKEYQLQEAHQQLVEAWRELKAAEITIRKMSQ